MQKNFTRLTVDMISTLYRHAEVWCANLADHTLPSQPGCLDCLLSLCIHSPRNCPATTNSHTDLQGMRLRHSGWRAEHVPLHLLGSQERVCTGQFDEKPWLQPDPAYNVDVSVSVFLWLAWPGIALSAGPCYILRSRRKATNH